MDVRVVTTNVVAYMLDDQKQQHGRKRAPCKGLRCGMIVDVYQLVRMVVVRMGVVGV